jgi:hypothetical protein
VRCVTFFDLQAIAFLCRTDAEKAKAAIQQEQVRSPACHVCNNVTFLSSRVRATGSGSGSCHTLCRTGKRYAAITRSFFCVSSIFFFAASCSVLIFHRQSDVAVGAAPEVGSTPGSPLRQGHGAEAAASTRETHNIFT